MAASQNPDTYLTDLQRNHFCEPLLQIINHPKQVKCQLWQDYESLESLPNILYQRMHIFVTVDPIDNSDQGNITWKEYPDCYL